MGHVASALSRFGGLVLVAVLAAPAAVAGCAVQSDDDADDTGAALSGHTFQEGTILRVTANSLNVRSRGSATAKILAVVHRDDLVTVIATSGGSGWVNIRTPDGDEGWSSGNYLTPQKNGETNGSEADDVDDTSTPAGATCHASRAVDIVNRYEKALHDTIAFAEGTRDRSNDGYDVLFGGSTYASCARHPNRCIKYGSTCSTAAGRYQFLYSTWNSIANARGYATFEPENQERGAAYLIGSVRKATIPTDRALTSAEFQNVMAKISYEWASLPPGRYGQPSKSMTQLRTLYCSFVDCAE